MANPFDPTSSYQPPKGDSRFLKLEKGQTEFLPLMHPAIGWQYWTTKNRAVRLMGSEEEQPDALTLPDIRMEDDGKYKVSHFWVFPVIDCRDGRVKLLEVTQRSLQKDIRAYILNPRWGDPVLKYTFTVDREGEKLSTKYTLMANPLSEIPSTWGMAWDDVRKAGFDLNEVFYEEGNPFAPKPRAGGPVTVQAAAAAAPAPNANPGYSYPYPGDNAQPPF